MKERVLSLETEYVVAHFPADVDEPPDPGSGLSAIRDELVDVYGIEDKEFLVNGSRVYPDLGHVEWSLPECRLAREVATYDRAADLALGAAADAGARALGWDPATLRLVKNNVDPSGRTRGCHENYQTLSETAWLSREDHLRATIRYLVPFLVTRQIWCGTGRVGWGRQLEDGVRFQMSQRADFIDCIASKETREGRAIVNLGRENEPFAAAAYRRLHLILGDANMSPWATFMKVGVTSLLLRLLEDLWLSDIPHLDDPVAAMRTISRDPTCRARVPLRDGRTVTAIDVQRAYLDQATAYLARHEASADERLILAEWTGALDALATNPLALCFKVDWVTKQQLLDRLLARDDSDWEQADDDDDVRAGLLRADVEYHQIAPPGLYARVVGARDHAWADPEAVRRAMSTPPPYTRARIRGDIIASARRLGFRPDVTWDSASFGGRSIALPDPLDFFDATVFEAFAPAKGESS